MGNFFKSISHLGQKSQEHVTQPNQVVRIDFDNFDMKEIDEIDKEPTQKQEVILPSKPNGASGGGDDPILVLEDNARQTVIRMLSEVPELDKNFSFKTSHNGGWNYVQAMRQVLSRVRNKAKTQKTTLQNFKFLVVGIENHPNYDLVTVIRTMKSSLKQKTVYDDIVASLIPEKEDE